MKKIVTLASILVPLLAFALFVWPTKYSYSTLDRNIEIRTNRLTGEEDVRTDEGWIPKNIALQ